MEAMVQEWTDGRLDDLSSKVDRGFEQVGHRFDRVEVEIKGLRTEMRDELKSLRTEMREEFSAVRTEMNGMRTEMNGIRTEVGAIQRTMVQGLVAITGAMVAGFAGIFVLLAAAL